MIKLKFGVEMNAKPSKKVSKVAARQPAEKKMAPKKKLGSFQKILTAEGWKRLMMGRSGKTSGKK